jgi:acetyl esterase/lipase
LGKNLNFFIKNMYIDMKKISLFLFFMYCKMTLIAQQPEILPLYPAGQIPNAKAAPEVVEKSEIRDNILIISQITEPTLTVYPAAKPNGTAVVICPGGGYWVVAAGHEGKDVALRLNAMGITAFVLKYRIPNDQTMWDKTIGPLQDVQQAFRMVRKEASRWGIDPKKVGVLGFSAGGHLASTAATHFKREVGPLADGSNLRPDFQVLIYPVITFGSFAHRGSAEALLGKNASQALLDLYSNEKQVTAQTPPAFLLHASDDEAVPVQNVLAYYEACLAHQVPAELHIYEKGGHGFGMKNPTTTDAWMDRLENWLRSRGLR